MQPRKPRPKPDADRLLEVQELVLQKVKQSVSVSITSEILMSCTVEQLGEMVSHDMYHALLTAWVPGKKTEHFVHRAVPASWWDAVKERWFKWIPWLDIQYERIEIHHETYHVCPHLSVFCDRSEHLSWLMYAGDEEKQLSDMLRRGKS